MKDLETKAGGHSAAHGAATSLAGDAIASAVRVAGALLNRSAGGRLPATTSVSGEAITGAARLVGALLSRSSGTALPALGSFLLNITQEAGNASGSPAPPAPGAGQGEFRPGQDAAPATRPAIVSAGADRPPAAKVPRRPAAQGEESSMQNVDVEAPTPEQRIAHCRGTIQQAAGDQQRTAEFDKGIIAFYTAAGRGKADAVAQAAAVRSYIEAVPDLLERLLQSAREPDVPDVWTAKHMALLDAALDAFDASSIVPDQFGLAGLLDNAYLASRLLPDELQVGLDHDRAIQILGPLTILQLDERLREIHAALAEGVKPADGKATNAPAPVSGGAARGDCKHCAHMRYGAPVVQTAFNNLLEAVRAPANQVFTQKLNQERETSSQFVEELEALKQQEDTYYTRRPTARRIMYCGVEEFDGTYQACEVKNLNRQCAQFQPAGEQPAHSCATCRHNRQIPSSVFHTVQLVAGHVSSGQRTRDRIKETLEMQAQSEFQECVEYGGFLQSARPGTLPICEARSGSGASGETRFVVGPVVNVAKRCDQWEAGQNEGVGRLEAELAALDRNAKQAWQDLTNPPVLESKWATYSDRLRDAAANADADVLEFGMNALGVYPSSVDTLCTMYVGDVGGTGSLRTPRASRGHVVDADAGYRRKEAPFIMEPGKLYRHPEEYRATLEGHFDSGVIDARDDFNTPIKFSIAAFPPDTWQRLTGPNGQPLRAALMVSRGARGEPTVQAAWL